MWSALWGKVGEREKLAKLALAPIGDLLVRAVGLLLEGEFRDVERFMGQGRGGFWRFLDSFWDLFSGEGKNHFGSCLLTLCRQFSSSEVFTLRFPR